MLLRGLILVALLAPGATAARMPWWHWLGRSVAGRPLRALELDGGAPRTRVLVFGCIHGTECAGTAVVDELARAPQRGIDLWLVRNLNPDGSAAGTRTNAHGVDLNRNFASEWRSGLRGLEFPGPRPFSEPESLAARDLIRRIHPQLTIWFHQPQDLVRAWGPSIPAARAYARAAGLRFRAIRWPHGSAPNWQNHRFPGCAAFVVELAPGRLAPTAARRLARAVAVSSRAARC